MKGVTRNPMHRAVREVIERVPALKADARPQALQDAAKHLAAQGVPGAEKVAHARAETLQRVRSEVVADLFKAEKKAAAARLTGDAANAHRPTALVSGGSMGGMMAAIGLAKAGQNVVIVEPHLEHARHMPFGSRQGMIDILAMLDPKLAREFVNHAARYHKQARVVADGTGAQVTRGPMMNSGSPDPQYAPNTGTGVVDSLQFGTIVAREFEAILEKYVKETFPDQIQFAQGRLHAATQPDGNVTWQLEKPGATKDAPRVYEDLLKGVKPSVVIVAEGSNSPTRQALGIKMEPTTPEQWWTAGLINKLDPTVKAGQASLRHLIDEKPGDGRLPTQQGAMSVTGTNGIWTITQMPPGYSPETKWSQQQVNDYYFKRAALLWETTPEELAKAGAAGPLIGSEPTPFKLQGKAAQEAARVLPDGTVVALIGDAVQTSSFQGGSGMNLSVSEVLSVLTLMEDLQSGVDPKRAAGRFQEQIFEHGNAWSHDSVTFFYPHLTEASTERLMNAEVKAITDWRKKDGPPPLARLQELLAKRPLAARPVGGVILV